MSKGDEVDISYTQERELSWLRFDQRVMEEAWDESVPLFERLKFAAIFTSNLEEFFMVRVGSIGDMALIRPNHVDSKSGLTPARQLSLILQAVRPLYRRRDKLVAELEKRLRACNICRLSPHELSQRERRQTERFFRDCAGPILSPLVVDSHHPFPHLPSGQLTIALSLRREGRDHLGLVPVPKTLPPFLVLEEPGLRYVLTEQIILSHAYALFEGYTVTSQAVIAVTRNADLPLEDEDSETQEDFRAHMKKLLKKRSRLSPVRLELQGNLDEAALSHLRSRLGLEAARVFQSKAPLSLRYVYALEERLPKESAAALCYSPFTPCWPSALSQKEPIIPQLLRQDVLLYYPYHSMEPFLRLVREASADPQVLSIKITIYRLASKTKLVEYLAAAAENGKDVTVLFELQARFDEQNNIRWAERLEEAGCTLIYGAEGFKVHSKVCLITRRERGAIQYITQIGTGNYNEKTARQYTDLCLMTAHPGLGADAAAFFQDLATGNLAGKYQYLLAAPHSLRPGLMGLIDEEINKGSEGFLFCKVNSVTDRALIDKLSQASQAGVKILLNVRGVCCLRPGIEGLTDNIRIFSIVGRFLEHARIFVFGKGDNAKMYLSSADFMTRNTQRRVELACPVLDETVRRQLSRYIELLCADNVKARELDEAGEWFFPNRRSGTELLDAQATLMEEAAQPPSLPSCPQGHQDASGFWIWLKKKLEWE